MNAEPIENSFRTTPQIAELCTQNGWPYADTIEVAVLESVGPAVSCAASFEEILIQGAGCVAGRVRCLGRYRLRLDAAGRVERAGRTA